MAVLSYSWCALLLITSIEALIIPQEFSTLLNVIYSHIPPILKGTDSRVGVGFRFGPHADFQVLLELGPQMYTQRLGPNPSETKLRRQVVKPDTVTVEGASNTAGSRWLSAWRSGFLNPTLNAANEVSDEKLVFPLEDPTKQDTELVAHLRKLYTNSKTTADS